MKAMILAAGLGTRLRPYSEILPKPLFPILDRPLILHLLNQLRGQGFGPFLINAHYRREQFVALLGRWPETTLQLEEQELGTGGGLRLAMDSLGPGPVLVMNGDTLISCRLAELRARHLASGARLSLVVHDHPRFNNLRVGSSGEVTAFRVGPADPRSDNADRLLAFTGVHFLDPALLSGIPPGRFQDLIDYYAFLAAGGERINVLEVRGHYWSDMGTPADYLALHRDLLTGQVHPWPDFLPRPSSPIMLGEGVAVGNGAVFEEWAMVGAGACIGAGATVRRSVVWPGAQIKAGTLLEDRIVVG
jgi:mannose-1-phosphate guanylyltransferase